LNFISEFWLMLQLSRIKSDNFSGVSVYSLCQSSIFHIDYSVVYAWLIHIWTQFSQLLMTALFALK
jgi:hypothetical protein